MPQAALSTTPRGSRLPANAAARDIAFTVYEIRIKPGIRYQPHPAFARDAAGEPVYHDLERARSRRQATCSRIFAQTGTRELKAQDFEYQIKRLAHPRLHSPILGLMSDYIVGLKEYADDAQARSMTRRAQKRRTPMPGSISTRYPLAGVEVVDDYTYRIKLKGSYPQFLYWLAMPFFAPVPMEADRFFGQPGMAKKNLTLDWYPVGTGPYMLTENNPNRAMVLERNPNFRGETYPDEGEPGDAAAGLLADAGKTAAVHRQARVHARKGRHSALEQVSAGLLRRFRHQLPTPSTRRCVSASRARRPSADSMREQGIQLSTSVAVSTYYMGFNMLDPVVGGGADAASRERARKLRQAISIAVDYEEYISIFQNGRGIPAQSPMPPGIFGFRDGEAGINPVVYDWDGRRGAAQADRSGEEAAGRSRLSERHRCQDRHAAGAVLRCHGARCRGQVACSTGIASSSRKSTSSCEVRATDYNRFQDKIRKGNAQIYEWGWHADYPDPENFLFLLHGPQSKVKSAGENASNYANPEFDRLFEQMKNMPNSPRAPGDHRPHARHPAPRCAVAVGLSSQGLRAVSRVVRQPEAEQDRLQHGQVPAHRRAACASSSARAWNRPVWWPLVLGVLAVLAAFAAAGVSLAWRAARARDGAAMIAYIIRRLLYAIPILIGVNVITFALFFLVNTPDDMARMQLGVKRVTPEAIANWKQERGYDKPLLYNAEAAGRRQAHRHHLFREVAAHVRVRFRPRRRRPRYRARNPHAHGAEPRASRCRCSWSGCSSTSRSRWRFAFFRATYIDFWGVVLCVATMSISSMFYIIGGQYLIGKLWHLVPISGFSRRARRAALPGAAGGRSA